MPEISVIIPCYNQGKYLNDAVDSVLAQSYTDFEIIVVNDGSSDEYTNQMLADFNRPRTRVLVTNNQGLAAARNNGIDEARGTFILPLDADDKIEPDYMKKAVALLKTDADVGIVYSKGRLFGAVDTDWDLPDFSLTRMLVDNIIFCSAFFRKADWLSVGGYDTGMLYGWEDYEFWLSLIELGRNVVQIPETLFCYRVASDSMVRSKEKWQKVEMFKRIYLRHQSLFSQNIEVWIDALLDIHEKYYTSRLYVDCGKGISDTDSVGRKVEQGTRRIVFDLTEFSEIKTLRFDPVDTFCVIEIEKIAIKYCTGGRAEVTTFESNALYDHDGILLFDTNDPQCFFHDLVDDKLCGVVELSIDLKFHALAGQALAHIVEFQKELLSSVSREKNLSTKLQRAGRSLFNTLTGPARKNF